MNKKGFTLIELLAVIVLLAIITVIAVPKIIDVIEKSERTAFGESAGLMAKAAELKYSEGNLTNTQSDETYEFENGNFKSGSPTLTFKGDKPNSGIIVQKQGKTTLAVISKNEKWCAIKNEGERLAKVYKIGKEIEKENCKIGYTDSDNKEDEEAYTCPDISTYPGKDLTAEADSNGYYVADNYAFSINTTSNEAALVGYIGKTGENVDIVIPKTINNIKITSINSGFSGKTFNSVTISPNIKTIYQGALSSATVNKLNLDYASELTNLSLNSLTSNGDIIIACNSNLNNPDFSRLNTKKLEIRDLNNLSDLNKYIFSDATIKNMELTNIPITTLDMSLVSHDSFETLKLKKLTKLTTISRNSFKDTKLKELILDNDSVPNLVTIEDYAFANSSDSKNLNSVVLKNLSNLTTIGNNAFSLQNISSLSLSGLTKLTTIGTQAFDSNNIKSINFKEMPNVTTIGSNAFARNPLTDLDFRGATKLTEIGESAFASNTDFKTIDFSGLKQNITGTLVATTGTVDTLNFSNTGADMTNFINNNIGSFSNIKEINLNNSAITELILQSRNIETINLKGSSITKFTDSNGSNKISKLDFSNLSNLKTIDINSEENLSTLNVKGSTNLESITCTSCSVLTKLDTGGLTKLNKIYMLGSKAVTTVRISESVPATNGNLLIDSDKLTCVQIDGDNTRFNTNFNTFFPSADSSVVKTTCNFN